MGYRFEGELVRIARRKRGFSRAQLAVRVGVSIATIENVERDKNNVSAATAYLIALHLGVPLEDLFTPAESVA